MCESLIRSFIMSDLSHERSERIAHSRLFDLSDLGCPSFHLEAKRSETKAKMSEAK